jgi:hypothetical protein
MALPPIGLTFPHKGSIFWAVPQLVLLDEVDTQNERVIEVWYHIKLVFDELFINVEVELASAWNRQRLTSSQFELWGCFTF